MSEPIRIRTAESELPHISSMSQLNDLMASGELEGMWYVPDNVYFASTPINQSSLKIMIEKTPAHMIARSARPFSSPDMEFGKRFHKCLLERQDFEKSYLVMPDFGPIRKTGDVTSAEAKENKNNREQWLGAYEKDKTKGIVTSEDFDRSKEMLQSCANSQIVQNMLSTGISEAAFFWREGDLWCKGKADYVRDDGIIVDVKTTKSADIESFQRDAAAYRYDFQAAWYLHGLRKALKKPMESFVIIAVEKTPPFAIAEFCFDPKWFEIANNDIAAALNCYRECQKRKHFPAYPQVVQSLPVPYWFAKRYE